MNKKLRTGMAAVAAGLVLAGCGADFENPVPPVAQNETVMETVALTVPEEPEPAAMLPWVGEHRTPVVEYPRGYEVGTRVWIVRHNGCETPAEVRERVVLAESGPYVIVFAPELAEERRSLAHRTADVQAFQDGRKRILIFSDAGGTGKSYHADRSEKNQQQRIHYVLQPGWSASNAVQGFGRTHRSNEVSAPVYKLVTTNIKGQKRFTSTIARRLDQLGALTKGQRDTGSGMFGAKDNLETDLARDALREFYKRLGNGQISGVDGMKTLDRLGLKEKFSDEYGAFKLDENTARDIPTFLNRIPPLRISAQSITKRHRLSLTDAALICLVPGSIPELAFRVSEREVERILLCLSQIHAVDLRQYLVALAGRIPERLRDRGRSCRETPGAGQGRG